MSRREREWGGKLEREREWWKNCKLGEREELEMETDRRRERWMNEDFWRGQMKRILELERHFQGSENSALDQISPLIATFIFCHICISLYNAECIKESSRGMGTKVPSNFSLPFSFFSYSLMFPKPILPLCLLLLIWNASLLPISRWKCGPEMYDFSFKTSIKYIVKAVVTLNVFYWVPKYLESWWI